MNEEISLREVLEALWKRKIMIIGLVIFAVVSSSIYSVFVLKPRYTVSSVLYIDFQPYKYSDKFMSLYENLTYQSRLDLEIYRGMVKDHDLLNEVIDELKLDRSKYTPEKLDRALRMDGVEWNDLYYLSMEGTEPELMVQVVNRLSEKLFDALKEWKTQLSFDISGSQILKQKEMSEKKLMEAVDELEAFLKKNPDFPQLEMVINEGLKKIAAYKMTLDDLELERNIHLADKEYIETQLAESNDYRQKLDEVNENIAAVERKIKETQKAVQELEDEIGKMQLQKTRKEIIYGDIQGRIEAHREVYREVANEYNASHIVSFDQAGNLSASVISKAYVPSSPDGPNVGVNILMATVAALVIGVFIALFRDYWERSTPGVKANVVSE